jgi:hypothetical protein
MNERCELLCGKRFTNQRRSRAAFFWAAGFFLLLQLVGSVVLDWCGLPIRFPSAYQVLEQATQQTAKTASSPDIIALGSSRFMFGLRDPDWQETMDRHSPPGQTVRVFNAAVPAGDQLSTELILDQLLARGVRPKWAIIDVTPESLNHFNAWLGNDVRRQLTWSDLPEYLVEICCALQIGDLMKSRLLPFWLHRKQLWQEGMTGANRLWDRYCSGDDAAGVENVLDKVMRSITDAPSTPHEQTRAGLKEIRALLRHYAVGGSSVAALDRTLERCRENGIHVILLWPPVSSWQRELYTPEMESAFLAHVQHLQAADGCTFVNFSSRVRDELFLDNHHLTAEGGRVFSELLVREVLAPAVEQLRYFGTPHSSEAEQPLNDEPITENGE